MFHVEERISAFEKLGRFISQYREERADEDLKKLNEYFLEGFRDTIDQAGIYNNWFTRDNVEYALQQWSLALSQNNLQAWVKRYLQTYFAPKEQKTVAIIMAGNIPLVGFHDLISVLITGHRALAKPSSDDDKLLPYIAQVLVAINRSFAEQMSFADGKIRDFDAVIATGSNNSARYFDYYFRKYPNIIRKNRSSVAILTGAESEDELRDLGHDIFRYFGLGCRNVSKLYLPEGYDLDKLFHAFYQYKEVINNQKYGNNYDYNRAIYMMENHDFLENGFMIIKENESFHAPVSVVHYENYTSLNAADQNLQSQSKQLQCIVSSSDKVTGGISLGTTQMPQLWDYADKVDTIEFLQTT